MAAPKKPSTPTKTTAPPDPMPPEAGAGIAYHQALNPAQLEAVRFGDGPLLVLAGAGSGKTRTLTYRVARLVEEGVDPRSILLLSFTRKASQEMLQRASLLLDARCRDVAGGTFHSFANATLRRYAAVIGFEQGFTIIDRGDAEDLIGIIRKEMDPPGDGRQLPRKSTLATIFSRAVNKQRPLEDVLYDDYGHFSDMVDTITTIREQYTRRKREHHFLDYDDLLIHLHLLLTEYEAVRQRLAAKYRYIMVDEYQDTNPIQADIVSLLADAHHNVMVVGDDAQSIYAFRGADYQNILDFPKRFQGTRIVKLEENYRSLQPILDFTNRLIESADAQYSKCLFTRRHGGLPPVLVMTAGENAQSRYVVREVARLRREGTSLDRMAILFRAGFHAFDLELELNRAGIPFKKVGGFKFTESAHIKDLLAHLRIVAAPDDQLSWRRVLGLIEKIGPKTADRIFAAVRAHSQGAGGLLSAPLKMKNQAKLQPLKDLIGALTDAPEAVARWGELVFSYYLPILRAKYDDHPRRQRDLEQLLAIMARYRHLDDFLSDMVLEPPSTAIEDGLAAAEPTAECLTLSTIHSAKGLEWDTVFILWALDGRFPSMRSMEDPDDLEEERRLMYVAATRAERELHLTCPVQIFDRATQSLLCDPSRFLDGIPENVLRRENYPDW